VPAQLPRGLLLLAPKVTKRVVIRNASCRTEAFAAQSGKTAGAGNLFAGLPRRLKTLYAKSSYAPGQLTGLLFFRIFPEALLLTKKLRHYNQ